jgi:hypothetical protein
MANIPRMKNVVRSVVNMLVEADYAFKTAFL